MRSKNFIPMAKFTGRAIPHRGPCSASIFRAAKMLSRTKTARMNHEDITQAE